MVRKNKQLIVDKDTGDCFRACMTSILGIPNSPKLPNVHDSGWFLHWIHFLRPYGLDLHYEQKACWRDGYWIATVDSKNYEGVTHAIVMKGHEVYHDPTTTKNKYKAGESLLGEKVVHGGFYMEVTDFPKLKKKLERGGTL